MQRALFFSSPSSWTWERVAARLSLPAILLVAAGLRTWQLSNNGFGRQYYAAAVRSMMGDWHNFFFNAFDPGGFVSLDKPPVAMWLQVLSAKLLGFGPLAMLVPQVIEGLAAIALLYFIVRRSFGNRAAAVAALLLAVTPISVAVDRSNNTESCLIVVLLLAAWVAMRAAETRKLTLLLVSMALVGVGFNVKMGAAVVVAPILVAVYLLAQREASWPRWAGQATAAGLVLVTISLMWVSIYDLTQPENRPYVGSTRGNSMFELALLHNGASRFMRPAEREARSIDVDAALEASSGTAGQGRPILWDDSPTGLLRLLRPHQAGQMAWWLPFALAGVLLGWRSVGYAEAARSRRIAVAVWTGWAASYWLLFSFAGGPFHTYYLAVLAPPLAALAGVGTIEAWRRLRARDGSRYALSIVLCASGGWQAYLVAGQINIASGNWITTLWVASIAMTLVGALVLTVSRSPVWAAIAVGMSAAVLAVPVVSSLSVVLVRPNVAAPAASLANFERSPTPRSATAQRRALASRDRLIDFLQSQRAEENFLVAVPNAMVAAPLILATGAPVMAMGGYVGTDPILTVERLMRLVEARQVRFVMLGGFSFAPRADAHRQALGDWVRSNGRPVDPALWRPAARSAADTYRVRVRDQWMTMATPELFDLRQ